MRPRALARPAAGSSASAARYNTGRCYLDEVVPGRVVAVDARGREGEILEVERGRPAQRLAGIRKRGVRQAGVDRRREARRGDAPSPGVTGAMQPLVFRIGQTRPLRGHLIGEAPPSAMPRSVVPPVL